MEIIGGILLSVLAIMLVLKLLKIGLGIVKIILYFAFIIVVCIGAFYLFDEYFNSDSTVESIDPATLSYDP
jgi:hypothetical protein